MGNSTPSTLRKKYLFHVAAALLSLFCLIGDGAAQEQMHEYSVKAALVLNFARFTQWPVQAPPADEPLGLCILGKKALAPAFLGIDGKTVNGRPLHVSFAEGPEEIPACNILFLTRDFEKMTPDEIFTLLGDRPVLTVGETPEFIAAGGMINLFEKNNRLRFEVNPGTIRRHGLKLSSRLLKLAIIVGNRWTEESP